jgi:hypothetical protein
VWPCGYWVANFGGCFCIFPLSCVPVEFLRGGRFDVDCATAVTGISGYRIRETAALSAVGSCHPAKTRTLRSV